MTTSSQIVYLNGEYLPLESAHISPLDRGFLFGDGVYEVAKYCRGNPFYYAAHLARLHKSLAGLRIPAPAETDFLTLGQKLLKENGLLETDALVYLQITRGTYAKRSHEFPVGECKPTVFAMASPAPPRDEKGIKLTSADDLRWDLCRFKTVNLLGNVLARQDAAEAGAQEVVLIRDGKVTECSSSALAIVRDGEVITHPPADYILPSVSILALRDICGQEKVPYAERPFGPEEIFSADEVLVLSSAFDIRHAVMLDGKSVGKGEAVCYRKFRKAFDDLLAVTN